MMVLVSYDVSTKDAQGKKRLREIAKLCVRHGQRVQNSVFEINIDYGKFMKMKQSLLKIINTDEDSVRFYYLGNNWQGKIEHIGAKDTYNSEGVIMI